MRLDLSDLDAVPQQPEFFSEGLNAANYSFNSNDHDLVRLQNGDVLYALGAMSKAPIPGGEPPWFHAVYRNSFGPGTRSVLLVWRSTDCGKTFKYEPAMEFDSGSVGDGTCGLPQLPRVYRHKPASNPAYLVPQPGSLHPDAEKDWRYCDRCKQLVYTGQGQASVCPARGPHNPAGDYAVLKTSDLPGETGWRRCQNCGALFHDAAKCAAQVTHDSAESDNYHLVQSTAPIAHFEAGWKWCAKCQTLIFGNDSTGTICPWGGQHQLDGNYEVALASVGNGDKGWRKCEKCRGLFHSEGGAALPCPHGGSHVGTGDYVQTAPPSNLTTQADWKKCARCGLLHYAKYESRCAVIGGHNGAGSDVYHMLVEGAAIGHVQDKWRRCEKCGVLYYSEYTDNSCPIGAPGEQAVYNAGGSDGQLVRADRDHQRAWLTFQCVGFLPDPGVTTQHYEATTTRVNKTLVATTTGNAPWTLLGQFSPKVWRAGIVPIDSDDVVLGFYDRVVPAKIDADKLMLDKAVVSASDLSWGDWNATKKNLPYAHIKSHMWVHTIPARTPGSDGVMLIASDILDGNKGFGYRIFFYDLQTKTFEEAVDNPIGPALENEKNVAFHLQAIDLGEGPIFLYWKDLDTETRHITVRGRFVTAKGEMSGDFAISRANGKPRSFDVTSEKPYWHGDYQTADGYISGSRYVYKPVWPEPGKRVRFAHVEYKRKLLFANLYEVELKPISTLDVPPITEQQLEQFKYRSP